MNKNVISYATGIALLISGLANEASAVYHEPYSGCRVYWDINSRQQLFPNGNYSRLIQLNDGRLMVVAEAEGGISVKYSTNEGQTWSDSQLIARSADKLPYAVPDVVQLSDGTILVGFNPRPSQPYSEDRRFGIRVMRSEDNGASWEGPLYVFDAQYTFSDGCWEPSFLELPSGEIHCYFANENNFTQSNEQEISVCSSFDKGKTWSEPRRVCYRAGSRDGMPSAILTDNGEIVVIIEDNGHPGQSGFRATTVRTTPENNWATWVDAGSASRNMIFANNSDKGYSSAAPYLRKLKSGETIASWQGDFYERQGSGEDGFDMYVAIGDADAKNFQAVTRPFALAENMHALWNSINVIENGNVFALASTGERGKGNGIEIMKGYPMNGFSANFGTPTINASFSGETWTAKNAQQVYLGVVSRNRSTMDFLYDDDNLYFYARVIDRDIFTDKVDNDGITLAFDINNCCDTYPQLGEYRIFLNVDGSVDFYRGDSGKWVKEDPTSDIRFATSLQKTYYDMEVAIPWKALGCEEAPTEKIMRCYLEVRDRKQTEIVTEGVTDALLRQSWTWPEFRLNGNGAGITEIVNDEVPDKGSKVTVNVGSIHVEAESEIESLALLDINGRHRKFTRCDSSSAELLTDETGLLFLEVRQKGLIPEYHKLWIGRQ